MGEQLLNLRDAARQLSVSPDFLKRLYRSNRLRVVRMGTAIRISQAEIDRLAREGVSSAGTG